MVLVKCLTQGWHMVTAQNEYLMLLLLVVLTPHQNSLKFFHIDLVTRRLLIHFGLINIMS